jgi:hypothetical protein
VISPALVGIAFGLLLAAIDLWFHITRVFVETHSLAGFSAPFPGSLLFYPGGAILVEVVYRLLPIPVLCG